MTDYLPLLLAIGALSLLPFAAMLMTSFAKIVIVLSILRQALGLQQIPPNMVINGIALILTAYIMAPVAMEANDTLRNSGRSIATLKTIADVDILYNAAATPMRNFLIKHASPQDRRFFQRAAARLWPEQRAQSLRDDDFLVLIPAFCMTELGEAFRIGFMIFLAFLLVDLVVATIVLALGMSMVSPTLISVPFKLLLFVMLEGWSRLLQGLLLGYQ